MKKLTGGVLLAKKSGSVYIPNRGHIIWIDFDDPAVGREQQGHRPALVISRSSYNQINGLAVVCPITSQQKNYSFEVPIPPGGNTVGVVLADHIKNVSWKGRNAKYIEKVDEDFVREVIRRTRVLIE